MSDSVSNRRFLLFFVVAMSMAFIFPALLDERVDAPGIAGVVSLVLLLVLAGWVYLGRRYRQASTGRGQIRWSRWNRRIASLVGYELLPCGCTYTNTVGRGYSTTKPDADVVEEETLWLRKETGERVVYRQAKEVLKRCHRCGQHYHDVDVIPRRLEGTRRECWPEEEPDVVAEFDAPVKDAEVVSDA